MVALAALTLMVLGGMAGCAQPGRPPVADRSPVFGRPSGSYEVRAGDTLYSIAWRFGLDHKDLARTNGIPAPYVIHAGQRIRLDVTQRAPARAVDRPPAVAAPAPREFPARVSADGWRAPTDAPVDRGYGNGNKGIDYSLGPRHRVRAAAAGEIVYAGTGLGGFRHLVIVKHDPAYLSAYSLDRTVAVREGQRIKAGDLLADMDEGGRRNGTLHFEIRRNGDPVDPGDLMGR